MSGCTSYSEHVGDESENPPSPASPPHYVDVVGRHLLEKKRTQHNVILSIYHQQSKKSLLQQKVSDNVYISLFS